MDKPPPYRRPMPPDYAPPPDIVLHEQNSASGVVGGVLAAYRVNPVLIAMIALLLTILGAFGWYAVRNDDRIAAYIAARDQQQADLWNRLVAMAKDCRLLEMNKENYPELDFPQLTTKPAPTPNKRDGK